MSIEEKFNAAVNVIKSLPKNGSYQPSNALKLDFYAYYKQATEGTNRGPRPGFWDVIGRTKWDAWERLGHMSREEAMQRYVDELNKIVETMALTDKVADFLSSLDAYPGNANDLELCIGPALDKARSQTNSPQGSRETSPNRARTSPTYSRSKPPSPDLFEVEEEDDEFVDTMEQSDSSVVPQRLPKEVAKRKDTPAILPHPIPNGFPAQPPNTRLPNGTIPNASHNNDKVSLVLHKTVEALAKDLADAKDKIRALEASQKRVSQKSKMLFGNLSPATIAFLIGWPIFVHYVLTRVRSRHSRT